MSGCNFSESIFSNVIFENCKLEGAIFTEGRIIDTKFEDIEFFSVIRGTDIDVKLEKISDINTVIEDMEKLINEEKSNLE